MTREKSLDLKKLTGFLNLIGKRLKKIHFSLVVSNIIRIFVLPKIN